VGVTDHSAVGVEGTLHGLVVAASSLLDPAALAKIAVREVCRVLDVEGATLSFWDSDQRLLVPLAFNDTHVGEPFPVFHPGQGLIGEAFSRQVPVIVADYRRDLANPPAWAEVVSGVGVPLYADGRLVGSLSGQTYHRREFTAADVEMIEFVAAQVGPALGTMRTLARAQREAAEAYALAALMRSGTELDDIDEVFKLVSDTAVRLTGADVVGLVIGDRQRRGMVWRGVVGNRTEAFREPQYTSTHPNRMRIFSGETLLHGGADGPLDPERYPFFAAEGVVVAVALPLDASDGERGALCLGWRFEAELGPSGLGVAAALAAYAGTLVSSRTSRAERDAIVAGAPVILAALLPDGVVTMWEGAGAAAIGIGPQAVGRQVLELLPDQPALAAAIRTAVTGTAPERFRMQVGQHTFDVSIELRDGGIFLVGTDVTDWCAAEQALLRRATEDELTGLPNRTEVIGRIAAVLEHEPVVVVVTDIRNFDEFNEALGRAAGDELLCKLGTRLARELADTVVVGRIGGDEFAVAGAGTDVTELCTRVRSSLQAVLDAGTEDAVAIDVRCGLASMAAGGDADVLLWQADSALQIARRGTATVAAWNAEEAERRRPQHSVAQRLRQALDARSFELVYQPILEVSTGTVLVVEALARWPQGDGEPVTPDVFVPLAERLGRIGDLTEHVLDLALGQVAGPYGVAVSVNISPLDVIHGDLPGYVAARLAAHGLKAQSLVLEVTEHAALETGVTGFDELAALGVGLAVDDYGRGWSSMETLKRVPAQYLKLDRSYVSGAPKNGTDEAIVRSAVMVGHALGMQVVAEGIEDELTLEAVRRFGCDCAQGYHIARPMPAAALGEWLRRHRQSRESA
jgi:diguanylate cyclase (GGDEF)-like protein